jgi:hypothetical protein
MFIRKQQEAALWLRLSVAGLLVRIPGLYPRVVHAEILVEKVALGQGLFGQHYPTNAL